MKGLSGTDDFYDLPLGLNVEGFWYNKELFEKAGCEAPTTWAEFPLHPVFQELLQIHPMLLELRIQLSQRVLYYTDKGFVEAAQKLADWSEKGYFGEGVTTVDANTAGSMVMSGKAAIFYTGSWFTQNLTDPSQNQLCWHLLL